uniref:Transmembrane protein n=1 Tax=Marseillevirus LCMAC202 TaxID=2506606 RepID=A0A481YZ92_9VIRU|nr:MAG: hypothetical protein LCMAC202_06820 [Marseillevirus LCMAC202]
MLVMVVVLVVVMVVVVVVGGVVRRRVGTAISQQQLHNICMYGPGGSRVGTPISKQPLHYIGVPIHAARTDRPVVIYCGIYSRIF